MPITIQPKQKMLTAVSDEELEERKLRKQRKIEAQQKEKLQAINEQRIKERIAQDIRNKKLRDEQEAQDKIEEIELKKLSGDLDISVLRDEDLDLDEKKEIIIFAKMCDDIFISPDNGAKIVAIVQHISKRGEWKRFPRIRAKVEFERPGASNITHKGIAPKYYRVVMNILGSETAGTDARVIKATSF